MPSKYIEKLNKLFIKSYNSLIKAEEKAIATGEFSNLSAKEIHCIVAVCNAVEKGDSTSKAIAKELDITQGTLTVCVTVLEHKGYLDREKRQGDKRQVFIVPTDKGLAVNEKYKAFQDTIVEQVQEELPEEQFDKLEKVISKITSFLKSKGE